MVLSRRPDIQQPEVLANDDGEKIDMPQEFGHGEEQSIQEDYMEEEEPTTTRRRFIYVTKRPRKYY